MVSQRTRSQSHSTADMQTERMLDAVDQLDTIKRYEALCQKIGEGTLDVPGFIKSISHDAAMKIATLMLTAEQEKVQLEAAKDILDRAGYNKTNKFAVASVTIDHQTSKAELINLIMSSAKRAGITPKDKPAVEVEEINVTPKPNAIDLGPGEWTTGVQPAAAKRTGDSGAKVCGKGKDLDGDDHDK